MRHLLYTLYNTMLYCRDRRLHRHDSTVAL